ncbi:MAG TPA: apolipoprotein N-acyltransferase, partial [Mycobacteriales bacterium]|nr:apolipoprotein N-acyltransferase [Mycobacteriales bacterium]
FPAVDAGWFAWVALIPQLLLLRSARSGRAAAALGWWAGAGYILATTYWLVPDLGPGLAVVAGLLGALWIPWGWLAHDLLRTDRPDVDPHEPGEPPGASGPTTAWPLGWRALAALLVLPSAWVFVETVRSWQSLGGPWALLGVSQWRHPALLGLAAVGGVWLLSAAIVATNVALTVLLLTGHAALRRVRGRGRGQVRGGTERSNRTAVVLAAAAVLTAVVAIGAGPLWAARYPLPPPTRTIRVALIQPGVVANPTARFDASATLTAGLRGQPLDLVVWGESSVGFDLGTRPDLRARIERLSAALGSDVLVNVDARAPGGGIFKTAVLVGPVGILGTYEKTRLVPFGEYVPLRPVLGWLSRVSRAAAEDRRRGRGPLVLHAGAVAFGPLVCFESTFPDLSRYDATHGAALIVYQSATSTFQDSWTPAQHAAVGAVRAAESGRPVVQAALTGVSIGFAADGRRLGMLGTRDRGTLVVAVPLQTRETPYDAVGELVPLLAVLVLAGTIAGRLTG